MAEVRKLTHMSISYNDSQLPVNRISLDIEKQPLEQALKVILKGTGFTYLIKDNYIMIVPEQNIKKAKSRNISGNVVDAKGEPLIGVTVIEKGTTNGAVTDLDGNYKRTIPYKQGALVTNLYDYDENHFLSQNVYSPENESSSSTFFLLSTQDGSWTDIELPYGKRISPVIVKRAADGIYASIPGNSFISSYQGDWILSEPSADTIYAHRPNGDLRPFMVRTPSVQTMTPEVFLFPGVLTDRYYFMQTVKKECDFEKNDKMPTVDLIYDRQEKKIYHSIVHNADFDNREEDLSVCALNEEVAFAVSLDALSLIEGKGKLKGQLKEIATHLGEEDNPVVMLAKMKNF